MDEKCWWFLFQLYAQRGEWIESRQTNTAIYLLKYLYVRGSNPRSTSRHNYQITNKGIQSVERKIKAIRQDIDKAHQWLNLAGVELEVTGENVE